MRGQASRLCLLVCVAGSASCGGDDGAGPPDAATPAVDVDILVVGAGTGGTSAALAAAKRGARVMVVEPSGWVGGQMAGVPALEDTREVFGVNHGFARVVATAITDHYAALGKSVATCGLNPAAPIVCSEPHVVRDLLVEQLQAAGVELRLRTDVTAIDGAGATVTGATLTDGTRVTTRVVIDATEYGDVLPLAGVEYRVGNQLSSRGIDPSACIQAITQVAPIRKYDAVPAGFTLVAPPGYTPALEAEFASRVVANAPGPGLPWSWALHNQYRGVPDSARPGSYDTSTPSAITRTNVNMANDYPDGETLSVSYLEDRATRDATDCAAVLRTLQFMYYVQQRLGGEQGDKWSISDDERFADSPAAVARSCPDLPAELAALLPYLPPRPYIRESRRIVAVHTVTGSELDRFGTQATRFRSAIAVGFYSMDLHGCSDPGQREADLGDQAVSPETLSQLGMFELPFESLIPVAVDGFLPAEKNIGVSRLAGGATRLQGITLLTGQAAGTIAAMAVEGGVQPRAVDPYAVQKALVADGAGLALDALADVPTTDARWGAIQLVVVRELIRAGTGEAYLPADALTRRDAAVAIATLYRLPLAPPPTASFGDVPTSDPAFAYIEAFFAAGYTSGCGGGNFCPDNPVTRTQLAVFLVKGLEPQPPACTVAPFADVPASDPACPAIAYATAHAILGDCGNGNFCPTMQVTRGDAATPLVAVMDVNGAP